MSDYGMLVDFDTREVLRPARRSEWVRWLYATRQPDAPRAITVEQRKVVVDGPPIPDGEIQCLRDRALADGDLALVALCELALGRSLAPAWAHALLGSRWAGLDRALARTECERELLIVWMNTL